MNKAELLFNAYKNRMHIDPFPLTEDEAKKIGEEFVNLLIRSEGLGGYKIALGGFGILTKPMITSSDKVELWFKNHKVEVEIVAYVRNNEIEKTFLGLEIPATRFTTWDLPTYYAVSDDYYAARLYVGPEIKPPFGQFRLYINDKLVGIGEPKYDPKERIKKGMEGFITLGAFIGPLSINKGDEIRVEGKVDIKVKLI
ncbi:MAG: 2-keto-4-pentenoate hydratase [Sulfolobaceae archaeon]